MTRRRFTADQKWRILQEGLKSGASVAEVCRRNQISESQYYRWHQQAEEAARERLAGNGGRGHEKSEREKQTLREQIARQQAIIAELVGENLELKKNSGLE